MILFILYDTVKPWFTAPLFTANLYLPRSLSFPHVRLLLLKSKDRHVNKTPIYREPRLTAVFPSPKYHGKSGFAFLCSLSKYCIRCLTTFSPSGAPSPAVMSLMSPQTPQYMPPSPAAVPSPSGYMQQPSPGTAQHLMGSPNYRAANSGKWGLLVSQSNIKSVR